MEIVHTKVNYNRNTGTVLVDLKDRLVAINTRLDELEAQIKLSTDINYILKNYYTSAVIESKLQLINNDINIRALAINEQLQDVRRLLNERATIKSVEDIESRITLMETEISAIKAILDNKANLSDIITPEIDLTSVYAQINSLRLEVEKKINKSDMISLPDLDTLSERLSGIESELYTKANKNEVLSIDAVNVINSRINDLENLITIMNQQHVNSINQIKTLIQQLHPENVIYNNP